MPTVHILIKGKVQGVFYRATAKEKAVQSDLTGWVKNTNEGNVESVVTGTSENIKTFIEWCKRGPSQAVVESVEITPLNEKMFDDFKILRRAE